MNQSILENAIKKFHKKEVLIWKDFEHKFEQRRNVCDILMINHDHTVGIDEDCEFCDILFGGFGSLISYIFYLRTRNESIQ